MSVLRCTSSTGKRETQEFSLPALSPRVTDPAAPYHPVCTSLERGTELNTFVVRMAGTLIDGSHVYEHISVSTVGLSKRLIDTPKPHRRLDKSELSEVRDMRERNPQFWTQRNLAREYGVSRFVVGRHAPAPNEVREKHNQEQESIEATKAKIRETKEARKQKQSTRHHVKRGYMG
jgi:hypothetical protein